MQEKELFQNYELKNWNFTPRLYKILGASAILNIFAFIMLAQANFLTAKSCDTPIVSGVCTVLDTLYVGTMIAGTDTGYVTEDYQKTELEDADITFINLTGQTPPLEYPEGYFAIANPQQPEVIDTAFPTTSTTTPNYIPGITNNPTITNNNPTTDLTITPQVTPRPNRRTVNGKLPTSVLGDNNQTTQTTRNTQNQTTTTQNQTTSQNQTTENTTNNQTQQNSVESEKVNEVTINKQVLKDFGSYVKGRVDNKEVDLNQPFKVVVEGPLTKDGKFDISIDSRTKKAKTQFTYWEGNEQMVDVAKKAIEAIGDSGALGYLRNFGAEKIKITLIQDGEKIFARIESDLKEANKANTMASGLRILLNTAKGRENLGEDEKMLLSGAQEPTSNGSMFIIDFAIPKADARAMIDRNLKKLEQTPKTENQNKTTTESANSQTTVK